MTHTKNERHVLRWKQQHQPLYFWGGCVKCSLKRLSLRRMEMSPLVSVGMENKDYLPSRHSNSTFPNSHDLFSMYLLHHPSSSNVPGSMSGQRDSVGSSMDLHCNWKVRSFNVTDNWVIVLNGYVSCIFFLCFCCLFFKATKGKHDKLCYFCAVTHVTFWKLPGYRIQFVLEVLVISSVKYQYHNKIWALLGFSQHALWCH